MRWVYIAILNAAIVSPLPAHIESSPSPAGPVYDLPGLHGTADQISKQIHADVDQLNANIADAQSALKNIDGEIANCRAYLATQLVKTDSTYSYVCNTLDESKKELAAATNKIQIDRLQNKVAGFSKRKTAIEDQDFPNDKQFADFTKHRAEQQSKIDALQQSLAKANAWRSKLAEAVRTTETFNWPITRGEHGIVGWAVIKRVSDDGVVTASALVFVPESKEGVKEGITIVRGHAFEATFIITGLHTDHLAAGQSVLLDQSVAVTAVDGDEEEGATVRARRSSNDVDDLLVVFREWQLQPTTMPDR